MSPEEKEKLLLKLANSAEEAGTKTIGKAVGAGGFVIKMIWFTLVAAGLMAVAFFLGSFFKKESDNIKNRGK